MAIAASLLNSPTISFSSSPPRREPQLTVPSQARTLATGGAVRPVAMLGLSAVGLALVMADPARAAASAALFLDGEPSNALSLPNVGRPCFQCHRMGEVSGNKSWKGLSWGMVPLLRGAFCAYVWHFFCNSESLEVLVALQAALTVIGNVTMCLAAFRIYRSSEECSKNM